MTANPGNEKGNANPAFELNEGLGNNNLDKHEIQKNGGTLKQIALDSLDIEDEDEDTLCGFACFRPKWMQKFANKTTFMVIFSLLAVIQGMGWSYMTGTITTIQKRFKISSQTTGIVIAGNEVSQIIFSLVLGYYGGKGHRPRWIAVGVLFSAAACFLLASPHLFYGAGEDALSLTEEYSHILEVPDKNFASHMTKAPVDGAKKSKVQLCMKTRIREKDDCDKGDASIIPLVFIFVSQFVAGIGVLLFFSLGGPYLDDNVEKTNSPMLFGITSSLRLVGPTLGFLFASACLKVFISPTLTPYIKTDDPRWVGAWWLGWIVLGILMAITALFISLFPKKLPKTVEREKKGAEKLAQLENSKSNSSIEPICDTVIIEESPNLKDVARRVKSLIQNRINLYNNLSTLFYIFAAIGYWTYMPKYLETIFMQTAVQASVISGAVGIATQSVGLLTSGWLISKYKPSARVLAGWNVFIGFLYVAVKISFTQMGCNREKFSFLTETSDGMTLNLTSSCNTDCNCLNNKFAPVCDKVSNQLFYSACHAGCTSYANGTISNCACLASPESTVTLGTCNEGCFYTFIVFLGMNAFIKLIDGSGRVGNLLVSYRCVHPKDKALSIALSIGVLSAFALLPGPILFGYIFDSVCLLWGTKCGGKGNCWLYNGEQLRYVFNLTAAAFTFTGATFDCLVWYHVKDLDLYDEEKNLEYWKNKKDAKNKK
ncbi:unnamed protein product [Allacma fusca]|uniref:Solute carrier organic anion transporter family member n=1 Tax=Allacma fusca TaxID=39272 RepID=A0A8J2JXK6_9HEXA|nr:unnamed protein product [Allacma fusca]